MSVDNSSKRHAASAGQISVLKLAQTSAHAARIHTLREGDAHHAGEFVLLWLHHAVRAEQNPALDVAIELSHSLAKPLLIYQGLAGAHRFNSDRHHSFILQGARDAAAQFAARGIRYVFNLEKSPNAGKQPSPLRALFAQAAFVVVEDFPAPPFPQWTRALAEHARGSVWAVDASCVAPLRANTQRFDRAFSFRSAQAKAWEAEIAKPYLELDYQGGYYSGAIGFDSFDFSTPIAEAVAHCQIDHSITAVRDTPGGSVAGYARWDAFKRTGLAGYAARRNDAADDGVSRMSAYLHHGHVSALRLAQEATAIGGAGAEKFLDELLVWRELSFHWCVHQQNPEALSALPTWAQQSLHAHRADPRTPCVNFEDFTRAQTGSALMDACQTSLLRQGEMHNNVRMTWAKGIAQWSATPEAALQTLIDLNHRYALDGNNPNSYGGLLWALGLFDRPFSPEQPVLGAIRPRDVAAHARRIDLAAFQRKVTRPNGPQHDVLVIGAGMTGASAARALVDQGHRVQLLDKARGAGGRMSTRRVDALQFDHGAQYFTARDLRFRRWVDAWQARGLLARWQPRLVSIDADGVHDKLVMKDKTEQLRRYVAIPAQNALVKHVLSDLAVHFDAQVSRIERESGLWRVFDAPGTRIAQATQLLLCVPAPQTAALLAEYPDALRFARSTTMQPCWAVMAAFLPALPLAFDGAFVNTGALSWIARDSSKPGRGTAMDCWVLHANAAWSEQHLEDTPEQVSAALLAEFARLTGAEVVPIYASAHRWRYALGKRDDAIDGHFYDADLQLGIAGDWCAGGRVEGAFLSGQALAGAVMRVNSGTAAGQ